MQTRWGAPEQVLELRSTVMQDPGPGELGLEIIAAPIHPVDQLRIRGLYAQPLAPPGIPGIEGVARVVQIGSELKSSPWKLGDLCLLPLRFGSYRTHARIPATQVFPLAAEIDPLQASMLILNPLSAELLLEQSALAPGEAFLNLPASGAVGQSLICLGRQRGLKSINLVRTMRWERWLRLLDRQAEMHQLGEWSKQIHRPRAKVAFDGVGGTFTRSLYPCLKRPGDLVVYGATSRKSPSIELSELIFQGLRVQGFWLHRWSIQPKNPTILTRINKLASLMVDGRLKMKIAACYGLEDYKQAFLAARDPISMGKVLLLPNGEP